MFFVKLRETPGPRPHGSGPAATRLKRSQMKRKHVKLPDRIMVAQRPPVHWKVNAKISLWKEKKRAVTEG